MKIRIYINRLLFIVLMQCVAWAALADDQRIKEAEAAYAKEDYQAAIQLYEAILKDNGPSAEIYYNLGNSCFKANQLAPAILNYERALLIDPGDADIRFNLQLARQRTVDNIEPLGRFFLAGWFDSVQNMGAADSWAKVGIFAFLMLIVCLLLFFFSRWIRMKKAGFYFGMLFLVVVVFANIFARNQKNELVNHQEAIVFSSTVTAKSSPDASGTDLFVLHEGTKVSIKSSLGEWYEIMLSDGNVGWMPRKDLEII